VWWESSRRCSSVKSECSGFLQSTDPHGYVAGLARTANGSPGRRPLLKRGPLSCFSIVASAAASASERADLPERRAWDSSRLSRILHQKRQPPPEIAPLRSASSYYRCRYRWDAQGGFIGDKQGGFIWDARGGSEWTKGDARGGYRGDAHLRGRMRMNKNKNKSGGGDGSSSSNIKITKQYYLNNNKNM